MLRRIILISLLFLSLATAGWVSASVTLGATITMTGSNTDVRFDVASALYWYTVIAPEIDRDSLVFSGAFYGNNIGWVEFTHVKLDCGTQLLNNIISDCILTGTGYNENIWDIDFWSVIYNSHTWILSGSATAQGMMIDLSGIILPLRPVELTISEVTVSQNAILTVSWAWMHDGGNQWWKWNIILQGTTISREISGIHGVYNIDLSLAGTYEVTIIDSNGSKTEWIILIANSGVASTTLNSGNYATTYCGSNTDISHCPDWFSRSATTLTQEPPTGTMVADGVSQYTFILKPRDQYGNRVTSGSMRIKYATTVKNIQTTIDENLPMFTLVSNHWNGDAFISNYLPTDTTGFWESEKTFSLNNDIIYTISSTAPTNLNNEIKLVSIKYIDTTINNTLSLWSSTPLTFEPPFTATVISAPPIIGQVTTFSGIVTGNIANITPTIISTFQIGDGIKAEWRSLGSIPTATCTNIPSNYSSPISSLCDWSGVSSIATMTGSDFSFTGKYMMNMWYTATPENTSVKTYIYYKTPDNKDILYNSQSNTLAESIISNARVTILGGSSAGLGISGQTRTDLINTLRERIALLSRNRTNYSAADYIVIKWNYEIPTNIWTTDTSNTPKRTIIIIGGDITIGENIIYRDHPLAIIALSDENNIWGNIIIKDWVSDIHGTLIAEHAIISIPTTTNQLYIHGSLISANPPRDLAPSFCPFFISGLCDPSDYDLPKQRWYTTPSIGWASYNTPLVIESDTRILSDPPPVVKK
jgi:hypothetical protein